MLRNALILLGLVLIPSSLCAGQLKMSGLSNISDYGLVEYSPGAPLSGTSPTEYIRISQYDLKYQAVQNAPWQSIYGYCVDLLHMDTGSPYPVTAESLGTATSLGVGAVNRNEMGYLFSKYGTKNMAGQNQQDTALQLALWDLSLSPTPNNGPNAFHVGTRTDQYHYPFYEDTHFGFESDLIINSKGLTPAQRTSFLGLVNSYLSEAYTAVTQDHYTVGNSADVLQNANPNGTGLQQNMLVAAPEPSTMLLVFGFAASLSCYQAVRGRRTGRAVC